MKTAYAPIIGRLGNNFFIYSWLRAWCEQNGYELSMDPWIGEKIFQIPEAIRPSQHKPDKVFPEAYYQDQASLIYTRKQVKEWFRFKPDILERLQPAKCDPNNVILNVREGNDYRGAGLVILDRGVYVKAFKKWGYNPMACMWESDMIPMRLHGFQGDESASGQGTTMVALPSFYTLMTARVLFRANSTFSWWASTLSENQKVYSPIVKGLPPGTNYECEFTEGNWPQMTTAPINTDLHLRNE